MSSPTPQGVIHDLGYRPFTGRRQSTAAVAASLYVTSLRHAFGIGRSAKSKVVPFLIAGLMLIPALVLAGLLVQLNKMSLSDQGDLIAPLANYFGYPYWTQLLITIFTAAQAPVLFARDLRYRTIVLYFARPLSRTTYVLVRLAALSTAIFAIVAVPLTIWYAAALTTHVSKSEHTGHYFAALAGVLVLALVLASFSGLVAALTTRAGLAVAAIIVGLLLTSGIVTSLLGLACTNHQSTLGYLAAMFTPFTVVAELISGLFHQPTPTSSLQHPSAGWTIGFVVAALVWVCACATALLLRIRKAASL
ncbi:ABC transporter permease [Rudaeicoccus suwonensis]|uniref:ABC-2 type transport system permease protein n=1 Tax=Rudaeicoccus suwonensis TaxID=657409 RepID=A0A561E0R8_9MICO|nr:ABC transporter permease [Rudaeicoccus suwonensis]TWE09193.1 ABC-2 type transport system permease protein [Rudaeicoccus suwonensis]